MVVGVDEDDREQGLWTWPKEWTFWGVSGRQGRKIPWLYIGVTVLFVVAALGIGLGVGLGVGLKKGAPPTQPDLSQLWEGCRYYFRMSANGSSQVVR